MRILGIETSCDETAAAVVDDQQQILSNIVRSQLTEHAAFGGVVPEIAARAHVEQLDTIVKAAMADADTGFEQLDAVAVTAGPGLIGGLIVGTMTAKAICAARKLPLYAINHLEGHALTARLTDNLAFPYLLLLVSGGHCQILSVEGLGIYRRLATTIDDAVGEAFDKVAKLLQLGHPGGPAVERLAKQGDPTRFSLPRPLSGTKRLAFSFSGLKTAVRTTAQRNTPLSQQDAADLCAGFQASVCQTLTGRIEMAMTVFKRAHPETVSPVLVAAGGVAANQSIRHALQLSARGSGFTFVAPSLSLCTDNAAMIAWAGLERRRAGFPGDELTFAPRSRWPLDEQAEPVLGSGKRGAKA